MDLSDVSQIMNQFEKSSTRELKIDQGDFHLYLSKNKDNVQTQPAAPASTPTVDEADTKSAADATNNEQTITAPLVGTVYLQPKPDAKPYVSVGDHVNAGDTVCVVEAMKMMTEIKSKYSGTITAVKVNNQELVEVSQPLFTVKED